MNFQIPPCRPPRRGDRHGTARPRRLARPPTRSTSARPRSTPRTGPSRCPRRASAAPCSGATPSARRTTCSPTPRRASPTAARASASSARARSASRRRAVTVFLADGFGSCAAFIKNCTPGLPDHRLGLRREERRHHDRLLRATFIDTLFGVPGCGGGDVCAQSRLVAQFGGADISGDLVLHDGIRQDATTGGVVKAALVIDCDNSPTITRFFNTTTPERSGGGGWHRSARRVRRDRALHDQQPVHLGERASTTT